LAKIHDALLAPTRHALGKPDALPSVGLNPFRGCFAAGTRIWSPEGYRQIEDFKVGDLVYARNEFDPSGPIEAKPIEELFRSVAPIVHLHVENQVIRTTGEHPFFVPGKGWIAAKDLEAG
jgi:hypothetical protein